jgi:hypothetical protein
MSFRTARGYTEKLCLEKRLQDKKKKKKKEEEEQNKRKV